MVHGRYHEGLGHLPQKIAHIKVLTVYNASRKLQAQPRNKLGPLTRACVKKSVIKKLFHQQRITKRYFKLHLKLF